MTDAPKPPLVCRDCGTTLERRTGTSGRQRLRCDACCVKHLRAYWLAYQRAKRARAKEATKA